MAAAERWYFTKEELLNSPSRKCGIDADKELSYRQQGANFIQDMGQRLSVTQLCINTAIVYMHRFYMFHSFSKFHRNELAACALFLAAKVEEQPRKLEHVIGVAHRCLYREDPPNPKSEAYFDKAQKLVQNENVMLQTLGFDVAIDHPHTHVVKCCQMVKGSYNAHSPSKDLAQTSYIMATNSLHLTTMCLQYKPTVVACMCIHLACKWSNWEIPHSSEGKEWFWYVDKTVTLELLEELTSDFLAILDKCPNRLKGKIMSSHKSGISEDETVEKKVKPESSATVTAAPDHSSPVISEYTSGSEKHEAKDNLFSNLDNRRVSPNLQPTLTQSSKKSTPLTYKEHKERKEREKLLHGTVTKPEPVTPQGSSTTQLRIPEKHISESNRVKPVQMLPTAAKREPTKHQNHPSSSTPSSKHNISTLKLNTKLEHIPSHSSPQGQPRPLTHESNASLDRQYICHSAKNNHHSSNHDRHSNSKHRNSHEKYEHRGIIHERSNAVHLSGGDLKDRHVHSSSGSSSVTKVHSFTNTSVSLKRPHSPYDSLSESGHPMKHQKIDCNKSHRKTGADSNLSCQSQSSLLNLPMPPGATLLHKSISGELKPPSAETNSRPCSFSGSPKTDLNHLHKLKVDSQKIKYSQPQINDHCSQSAELLSKIQLPPNPPPLLSSYKQSTFLNTKFLPLPIPQLSILGMPPSLLSQHSLPPPPPPPLPAEPPMPRTPPPPPPPPE